MRRLYRTPAVALVVLLVACTSLGIEPAKTLNQQLAYAYGTHTAVLQAATASVNASTLSSADAQEVLKLSDDAKAVLDAAMVASVAGDTTGANNKLALALATLTAAQTFLNSHTGK